MAIPQKTLAATGSHVLGDTGPDTIGSWQVQVTGTWTGSFVFTGWIPGSTLTSSDKAAIAYKPMKTGTVTDGATTITANGIYIVPADGLMVSLDWTRSSGSIVIDAVPIDG